MAESNPMAHCKGKDRPFLGIFFISILLLIMTACQEAQDDDEPQPDPSFMRVVPTEGVSRTMTLARINAFVPQDDGPGRRVVRDVPNFPHWVFEPLDGAEPTRWRVEFQICECRSEGGRVVFTGFSVKQVRAVDDEGFSGAIVKGFPPVYHPPRPAPVPLENSGIPCTKADGNAGTWYCHSGNWVETVENRPGLRLQVSASLGTGREAKRVHAKIRQGTENGDAGGDWQDVTGDDEE